MTEHGPAADAPPRRDPRPERGERAAPAARGHDGQQPQQPESPSRQDRPPTRRRRWPLFALAAAIIIGAIIAVTWWLLTRDQVSTDDAFTDGRAVMVAAQISGTVRTLAVNDNQRVRQGDLLIEIDDSQYRAARDQAAGQLAAAQAQLAYARAALDKAETVYPAQLRQAEGQLEQVQGQLFQARADYDRQHHLPRAATSQQSIDASTANLRQAEGQVKQAEAQVAQAGLVSQNLAQARTQVAQLEGQVQQARANLETAEINLGYTRITAPQDGWVTRRNVELGNFVQPGIQLMAIVAPEVWVTANFKETQLSRMHAGQTVDISVDAWPDLNLTGHVDSVQLGSGTKFTAFPPENATGNFVKIVQRVPVKIVIDRGLDPQRPLPLGLSVVPTVRLK